MAHVHWVRSEFVDAVVAHDVMFAPEYFYGGTRCVPFGCSDEYAINAAIRLMIDESAIKNHLINLALSNQKIIETFSPRVPAGLLGSRVGGARCVLVPRTPDAFVALQEPGSSAFGEVTTPLFAALGHHLDEMGGRIKLTPDFGRFAGISDALSQHTEHVLGIRCEAGGCGGKSSYSASGVIAAAHSVGQAHEGRVTVIGADGAMGRDITPAFMADQDIEVAVCDLAYDDGTSARPNGLTVLRSERGAFTKECLSRGGTIIATTLGGELAASEWSTIPSGTVVLLAHNLALPAGEAGVKLASCLAGQGVLLIPGQLLTLGGALTSRLEWYHRQATQGQEFGPELKTLAHELVADICSTLATQTLAIAAADQCTPFEAMLRLARRDYAGYHAIATGDGGGLRR